MKMPPPIATKFTKLVLTILAITILGIILSFISQDHTLLMLSAGVAVAGGVKIIDYYRTIKGEHYECIEGTLVREQAGYARKRHTIVLALEDGSLEQRILEGRYKFESCTAHQKKTLKLQWLQGFFVALKGLFVPRLFHYAFFFPKLTGSDAARPALASACAVSKAWE